MLLKYISIEGYFDNSLESLLLGGRNYCKTTILKPSFVKFRDERKSCWNRVGQVTDHKGWGLFIEEKHTDFVRDSAYMVHTQNLLIMLHLLVAINVGVRQGRHPVSQDCRVAPLYQELSGHLS